ncbi:hypothetical protein [Flavobacterium columnare]|uniref:Uncharacterized protein n=1 Tax=Flavobacterium columnare TaxID=996 RepID=A0AA94F3I3_9FLAO|nr:hypothetical protein [Flavobacterium columnare]MCH4829343.1 hypothetical protein [Flavobacterium columnare]MCH4834119.1 hypothetical protein [Flavobacterium columnare]
MATFSLPHRYITLKRRQGFVRKKIDIKKPTHTTSNIEIKKPKVLRQSTTQGVKKKRKEYLEAFQKP